MGRPNLIILGIRGVPAAHGGFETFAEKLALWLRDQGWPVVVYCQSQVDRRCEDDWEGIRRIHIPERGSGAAATMLFDIESTRDVLAQPGIILTLGYNTGFLAGWLRLRGRTNIINMDGLEWKRAKYSAFARAYLWVNERLAAWSGDHLVADHPAIGDHLATRVPRAKITMIPYGAQGVENANPALLAPLGLEPGCYFTLIARPEPENSVLEIVKAFSRRARGARLVVLGRYKSDHAYQARVLEAAGDEVLFPGAIYDEASVAALRYFSLAYLHGHQVGGTNPSLVEALGSGNAIIAHDNRFNRWVAGDSALYFSSVDGCEAAIEAILTDPVRRAAMQQAARTRWSETFTWPQVLGQYQALIERMTATEQPA